MLTTPGFHARTATLDGESHRYQVYVPEGYDAGAGWPAVLFLHGAGEGGSDGEAQTHVGLGRAIRDDPARFPLVAVFPQSIRGHPWRGPMIARALQALDRTVDELAIDLEQVHLTGVSMGGYGTWRVALEHPDRFATLVPVCGGLDSSARGRRVMARAEVSPATPYDAAAAVLRDVPIWIFHGDADSIIPVEESRVMVAALRRANGTVRYTEYEGVGHNSWDPAYDEEELVPWMLGHRLRGRRPASRLDTGER